MVCKHNYGINMRQFRLMLMPKFFLIKQMLYFALGQRGWLEIIPWSSKYLATRNSFAS